MGELDYLLALLIPYAEDCRRRYPRVTLIVLFVVNVPRYFLWLVAVPVAVVVATVTAVYVLRAFGLVTKGFSVSFG